MDVAMIVTLLIMFCVIIAVMLNEMQKLNEESEKLKKEIERVNRQRYIEDERHKELQQILKNRLEEVKQALEEPAPKLQTEQLKPLHFVYSMKHDERMQIIDDKLSIQAVAESRLLPQVITELKKRIIEQPDPRRGETNYILDIWLTKY